ncbi:hypothetical protein V2P56_02905 [Mycoplasma capricolum subsp. capricolum]|uniref:hypothetical protein n=1 Tax=Mycoplasma capricolum TaxID=2095 RepID=UPI003DA44E1C
MLCNENNGLDLFVLTIKSKDKSYYLTKVDIVHISSENWSIKTTNNQLTNWLVKN